MVTSINNQITYVRGLSTKPDVSTSLVFVDLLKVLKTMMDYRTLSAHTGLPISTLTRYVTNKTIPRGKNIPVLIGKLLEHVDIKSLIMHRLLTDGEEIDVSAVVTETNLVKLILPYMVKEFVGYKIDSLIAIDKPGLILATAFGLTMMKKVFYCQNHETGFPNYWKEVKFRIRELRTWSRLFIPKDVLKSNVLFVGGVLDNPTLINELRNRIVESKGDVVGVFSIVLTKNFMKSAKPYKLGKVVNIISL